MKYSKYKEEVLTKYQEETGKKHGLFFALNDEQFDKGIKKNNLKKGEKVTDIGAGGFLPSKNVNAFIKDIKKAPMFEGDRKEAIMYELHNHEYKMTLDFEQCIDTVHEILQSNVDPKMERDEILNYAIGRNN